MTNTTRTRTRVRLLSIAGVCLIMGAPARGQCPDPVWQSMSEVPGVHGQVRAMVEWDPDGPGPREPILVVGGQIDGAGNRVVSGVAAWDGAAWSDELGGFGIAELEPGGAYGLLVHDGALFAATANVVDSAGSPNGGVYRWSGSRWDAVGDLYGDCDALVEFDGGIATAGHFRIAGGDTVDQVAWWDGTAWHSWGTFERAGEQFPGTVDRLSILQNDLVATGRFTAAGGVPSAGAARWTGTTWADLGLPTAATCLGIAGNSKATFASAQFGSGFNITFRLFQRQGGAWQEVQSPFVPYSIPQSLAGDLYLSSLPWVGGSGGPDGLARFENGRWTMVGTGLGPYVACLASYHGQLVAGGALPTVSGVAAQGVAVLANGVWHGTGHGLSGLVDALAVWRGQLYAAGRGLCTDAQPGPGILRWNGSNWELVPGLGEARALAVYQDALVFPSESNGHLMSYDGTTVTDIGPADTGTMYIPHVLEGTLYTTDWRSNTVHRLDPAGWVQLSGTLASFTPPTLANHNGSLYAARIDMDGFWDTRVGRWTGSAWEPVGSVPLNVVLDPWSLTSFNGSLIAGGAHLTFDHVGGFAVHNFAVLDGDCWRFIEDAPLGAGITARVVGSNFLASSNFDTGNHSPLLSWDGAVWRTLATAWNGANETVGVFDYVEFGGGLVVGGAFTSLNGTPANMVARTVVLPCCGSADFDGDGHAGTDADIQAFFACLAGNCCPACGNPDFNYDGDVATDADIEAFFRVLAGGAC